MSFSFLNKAASAAGGGSAPRLADNNFLLVAVPKDRCSRAVDVAAPKVGSAAISVTGFNLEELRLGTLDSLMALADDIGKVDSFVGNVCRKIAKQALDIGIRCNGALDTSLAIRNRDISSFVRDFKWDMSQYKTSASLRETANLISSEVTAMDAEFRKKSGAYQQVLNSVKAVDRKKDANLMSRPLEDIVVPKLHVVDTEHLTSLFVVVANSNVKEWERRYEQILFGLADEERRAAEAKRAEAEAKEAEERAVRDLRALDRETKIAGFRAAKWTEEAIQKQRKKWEEEDAAERPHTSAASAAAALTPDQLKDQSRLAEIKNGGWVVPRSSLKIVAEKDFTLFRVVVFRALADDFRTACGRTKMFAVRDYVPSREPTASAAASSGEDGAANLADELAVQEKALLQWCRSFFSDAYAAWVHLKVIRLYIEMVLRYGLPGNSSSHAISDSFSAMLIEFDKRNRDKLLKSLDAVFKFLQPKHVANAKDDEEVSVGGMGEKMISCAYTAMELDTSTAN